MELRRCHQLVTFSLSASKGFKKLNLKSSLSNKFYVTNNRTCNNDTPIKLVIWSYHQLCFLAAKWEGNGFAEWTRWDLSSSFNLNQIIKMTVLDVINYLIYDHLINELYKPRPFLLSFFNPFKTTMKHQWLC